MQLRPDSGGTDETGQTSLPRGTMVHVNGFPFRMMRATPVEGRPENRRLALTEVRKKRRRAAADGLNPSSLSRTERDVSYLDLVYR